MEYITHDGVNLYYEINKVENPKATIVLVHGLGENLRRYDLFVNELNALGYVVYRFDHRGHGMSGGKRGWAKSFMDIVKDTDEFVEMSRRDYPNIKHFLFGHSMGGFTVNAYGVTYKDKLDGIISSAAPGIIMKMTKPLTFVPWKLIGNIDMKNTLGGKLSHDPKVEEEYIKSPLNLTKYKIRLAGTMFVEGVRYIHKNMKNFSCPVLYLHGVDDPIVEVESTKWLFENNPQKDKEVCYYDGMYHEILNEIGREKVVKDILDWLNKR
jgi:lysophospholipase